MASNRKIEPYFQPGYRIIDPKTRSEYTLRKLIGRGAYGQCYLGIGKDGNYAVKVMRLSDLKSSKVLQKLKTEIEIHSRLDNPYIVKLYKYFKLDGYVFMVLELCERGALDDLLRRNVSLKEKYASRFFGQILEGVKYLHEKCNVIHRDLKLGNLFLDGNLNVKIGDFGLCAQMEGKMKRKTICGTPNYIAPEIIFKNGCGHSYEADIWSLGVILYTMLIGKPPFQQGNVEEIYRRISRNEYCFPPNCELSSDAIDLITRILNTDPMQRPTLDEIFSHRFLGKKESLALRLCRSLETGKYIIQDIETDYVESSMPVAQIEGIGYRLKSGIIGIYYGNFVNAYMKPHSLVVVRLQTESGKKVFFTEEHLLSTIPSLFQKYYRDIIYFRENYVETGFLSVKSLYRRENNNESENETNIIEYKQARNGSKNTKAGYVKKKSFVTPGAFVAKVKKIDGGLLFIMTNNVLVLDFSHGERAVISDEGRLVYAFDNNGPVEFEEELKERCIETLRRYCPLNSHKS